MPPGEGRSRSEGMRIVYADYARCLKRNDRIGSFDSWTILDEKTAIKKCDKSFFEYKGSGVPKEICWFFDAEEMELGQVIPIKLIYQGAEFEGKIKGFRPFDAFLQKHQMTGFLF